MDPSLNPPSDSPSPPSLIPSSILKDIIVISDPTAPPLPPSFPLFPSFPPSASSLPPSAPQLPYPSFPPIRHSHFLGKKKKKTKTRGGGEPPKSKQEEVEELQAERRRRKSGARNENEDEATSLEKLAWMMPPTKKETSSSSSLPRFGLSGELIPTGAGAAAAAASSSFSYESDRSLYHHSGDPDRPGYTVSELLTLSLSTSLPQARAGKEILRKVVRRRREMTRQWWDEILGVGVGDGDGPVPLLGEVVAEIVVGRNDDFWRIWKKYWRRSEGGSGSETRECGCVTCCEGAVWNREKRMQWKESCSWVWKVLKRYQSVVVAGKKCDSPTQTEGSDQSQCRLVSQSLAILGSLSGILFDRLLDEMGIVVWFLENETTAANSELFCQLAERCVVMHRLATGAPLPRPLEIRIRECVFRSFQEKGSSGSSPLVNAAIFYGDLLTPSLLIRKARSLLGSGSGSEEEEEVIRGIFRILMSPEFVKSDEVLDLVLRFQEDELMLAVDLGLRLSLLCSCLTCADHRESLMRTDSRLWRRFHEVFLVPEFAEILKERLVSAVDRFSANEIAADLSQAFQFAPLEDTGGILASADGRSDEEQFENWCKLLPDVSFVTSLLRYELIVTQSYRESVKIVSDEQLREILSHYFRVMSSFRALFVSKRRKLMVAPFVALGNVLRMTSYAARLPKEHALSLRLFQAYGSLLPRECPAFVELCGDIITTPVEELALRLREIIFSKSPTLSPDWFVFVIENCYLGRFEAMTTDLLEASLAFVINCGVHARLYMDAVIPAHIRLMHVLKIFLLKAENDFRWWQEDTISEFLSRFVRLYLENDFVRPISELPDRAIFLRFVESLLEVFAAESFGDELFATFVALFLGNQWPFNVRTLVVTKLRKNMFRTIRIASEETQALFLGQNAPLSRDLHDDDQRDLLEYLRAIVVEVLSWKDEEEREWLRENEFVFDWMVRQLRVLLPLLKDTLRPLVEDDISLDLRKLLLS